MPVDYSNFEKTSRVSFKDKNLLRQAFTHRSYINEHRKLKLEHNERLEFLGDAVLELVVTEYLYQKYQDRTEGELTAYRSALVNAITLADVARDLGMEYYLLLSRGEAKDKGRARQYILANTFEAVVGAMFLDGGYGVAQAFISRTLFHLTDKVVQEKLWLDAKSHFQERAQDKFGTTPHYRTMQEIGPDHDKFFTVAVFLGDTLVAEGEGRSKQDAEQSAARNALEKNGWL